MTSAAKERHPARREEDLRNTVLVVEDETFARLYATHLFEDEGYLVIEAEKAEDAIVALQRHPKIALLFADIRLPGEMSGRSS